MYGLNWNEYYPVYSDFENDALKNELYILKQNREIIGVVVLNSKEDKKWKKDKWKKYYKISEKRYWLFLQGIL